MAFSDRTHYDVLGISCDADAKQIRSAWKLYVQAWHPDRFGDAQKEEAERQTSLVNEAYSTLRDSARRAAYDCKLAADAQRQNADAASKIDARQPVRKGSARVGSPMEQPQAGVRSAQGSASFFDQLSQACDDFARSLRNHPKLVIIASILTLLFMTTGVAASALNKPQVPAAIKSSPVISNAGVDDSSSEDLEKLAQQAQAEAAATNEALLQMQREDDRQAALDRAMQKRAELAARKQAAKDRSNKSSGKKRVIRIMPDSMR